MNKKYLHIYFDLDRTLWDYESNANTALENIYNKQQLQEIFSTPGEFTHMFHKHNERLWNQYSKGLLKKNILRNKRFELTLKEKGQKNPELVVRISKEFLRLCMEQTLVFPGTHEILSYLKEKGYYLYLLTNGFRDTQFTKLKNCALEPYFHKIFTSDTIGYHKPHKNIFHWAVSSVHAKKEECLMIGDNEEADIMGAKKYGMDQVFFNPEGLKIRTVPTYEIRSLSELRKIL